MKCLITGAAGFIGSHLCEQLLERGFEVTAFVHYNSRDDIGNLLFLPKDKLDHIRIIKGDIQDSFSVDSAVKDADCVFHLAALIGIPYSYLAPASYISVNVTGTLNVLEAAKKHRIKKMVHTSTSETYGSAHYVPIDEKHPLQGQSPYSASKIGADHLAESFYRSFDVPVAIIRPFNTFGPRQSSRAVIPTIINQLLSGSKEIKIGSIYPVRDFNYVLDTVDGFISIAMSDSTSGKTINIGSGAGYTIKETFDLINKKLGLNAKIVQEESRIRPKKSEVDKLLCDYSLAKSIVNYEPKWSFEKGIENTIGFFKENRHRRKNEGYVI
jgi:NAD dependent epimerase/dehydratase